MHLLHLLDSTGGLRIVNYDPMTSKLTDAAGNDILSHTIYDMHPVPEGYWEGTTPYTPISPENPGRKSSAPRRIKIQLGLGCNETCPHCLQAKEVGKATKSSTLQAEKFIKNLSSWVTDPEGVKKIELWGGEPLLYWEHIKLMMPGLKAFFPNAKFGMVTNALLLTEEIVDQLKAWEFGIAISHDGPGHEMSRGYPDPFENTDVCAAIQYATDELAPHASFNVVLKPGNCNVAEIINWFDKRLPGVNINFEGVVHDYNGDASSRFSDEELAVFSHQLTNQLITGAALKSSNSMQVYMRAAMDTILKRRPASVLGQKCGMDRMDEVAVDLEGWVTTCQNVGGQGEHKIGHVSNMKAVRLKTSWHWSQRKECSTCPVLQLCAGSCMFQTGNNFTSSCNAEYAYRMAFFTAALYLLTGRRLVGIDGPIVRPQYV